MSREIFNLITVIFNMILLFAIYKQGQIIQREVKPLIKELKGTEDEQGIL